MATIGNRIRYRVRKWKGPKVRGAADRVMVQHEHWVVDFTVKLRNGATHRIQKGGFASRSLAQGWFRDEQHAIQSETAEVVLRLLPPVPESERPVTISEFIDRYKVAAFPKKRATTQARDSLAFTAFVAHVKGETLLADITSEHLERFVAARGDAGMKEATVARDLAAVRTLFGTAKKWKVLPDNPAEGVKAPTIPSRDPVYLEIHEQEALLRAARSNTRAPYLAPMIALALYTGLRRGELFNLKWCHIDLDRGSLKVKNTEDFQTKSGKDRIVGLSAGAVRELKDWRQWFRDEIARLQEETAAHQAQRRERGLAEPDQREVRLDRRLETLRRCEPRPDRYVFPSFVEGDLETGPVCLDNVRKTLKAAVTAAGITRPVSLHVFRHTFVVTSARQGKSLWDVSKALGHASVVTTQKHYANVYPDAGANVGKDYPDLGGGVATPSQHEEKAGRKSGEAETG